MKLKKFLIFLIPIILTLFIGSSTIASSKTIDVQNNEVVISDSGSRIEKNIYAGSLDVNLYDCLLAKYNQGKEEGCKVTTLTNLMFIDDTSLDLSNQRIESLDGLQLIYFDNLESLNLSENSIVKTSSIHYSNMPKLKTLFLQDQKEDILNTVELSEVITGSIEKYNLSSIETLNVSGNSLTTLKIDALIEYDEDNSKYIGLNKLIANNNKLTSIDISTMISVSAENLIYVNLSSNNFSSISNIAFAKNSLLSTDIDYNVLLFDNNICDYNNLLSYLKIYLGVQGVSSTSNKTVFGLNYRAKYYKTNIENATLKISKFKMVDGEKQVLSTSYLKESDMESYSINLFSSFSVGSYDFEFGKFEDDIFILSTYVVEDNIGETNSLKKYSISLIPSSPKINIEYKNETYSPSDIPKISEPATIKATADGDAEIYYRIGNSTEWINGTEYKITSGGSSSYSFKAIIDGVESETVSFIVFGANNLYISDFVLAMLIVGFACIFFLGAVPLIVKFANKH